MVSPSDQSVTHPDKILFPDIGLTKGELCQYYEAVAPLMVPQLVGRPLTLERYPAGIDKKGFIQKDVTKGFPEWLERVAVPRRAGRSEEPVHYPLVSDARGLRWLANLNTVTPHVWCARLPALDRPDLCVFDLDPPRDDPATLRVAALAVRDLLRGLGVPSFVKTSGSKGFHIVVPLDSSATFEQAWRFSHGVGRCLVKAQPELFTQEFIKADRADRILIDTGRNARGATFAAAYAVRARPGAPVSAPCTWDEVEAATVSPQSVTLHAMHERLERCGDSWSELERRRLSLEAPLAAVEARLSETDWAEAAAATTRRPRSRQKRPSSP